ncbi:helix-turn-helix domain-containing protein [Actinomadura barringtoniae]|uniref:helix-turn-helix domain-containing protein n=1 Tax=Actinomadura barringtoniae TaxID=1427535 RepID=UPI0027DB17BC|nr:helix-turn-helix transcriptional regulator [Actinomadura barringtoniae]
MGNSNNDLGAYLRTRRESVGPAEVGLPVGARRRTPGLRRAELATLAGISVEYLTRLEQGRDRRPSPEVLSALADALLMGVDERMHLMRLSKAADGTNTSLCCAGRSPARTVRPTVRALLESLEPAPAVLLNQLNDVLAYTRGYERITRPLGMLDGDEPNLLAYVFTDDRARIAYPDWDRVADERVAEMHFDLTLSDPEMTRMSDHLTLLAGAPFKERIAAPMGPLHTTGVERIVHPEVGELRLAYETLQLPGAQEMRLMVYLPADDATAVALDRLAGRQPGALRAVIG